jgi:hypothetical protein
MCPLHPCLPVHICIPSTRPTYVKYPACGLVCE